MKNNKEKKYDKKTIKEEDVVVFEDEEVVNCEK